MMSSHERKRRTIVAAVAALPISGAAAKGDGGETVHIAKSRILVAYFSRSGNTRVVAGLLQRALNADVFEIRPANLYPDEYLATVEQARQERDSGFEPALAARVSDMSRYDTVYLGFPIWGETAPPIIRAFLATHDLAGKALTPFVTHGGYGVGNSMSVLAIKAPRTKIGRPFVMQADQERRAMNLVNEWFEKTGVANVSPAS